MLTPLLHEAKQVIQELLPLGVRVQFIELWAKYAWISGGWGGWGGRRDTAPPRGDSNRSSADPTHPKLQTRRDPSTTSRGHYPMPPGRILSTSPRGWELWALFHTVHQSIYCLPSPGGSPFSCLQCRVTERPSAHPGCGCWGGGSDAGRLSQDYVLGACGHWDLLVEQREVGGDN